jgi:hypothetical protein
MIAEVMLSPCLCAAFIEVNKGICRITRAASSQAHHSDIACRLPASRLASGQWCADAGRKSCAEGKTRRQLRLGTLPAYPTFCRRVAACNTWGLPLAAGKRDVLSCPPYM